MSIVVRTFGITFQQHKHGKYYVVCKIGKEKKSGQASSHAQGGKVQLHDTIMLPYDSKHEKMKILIRNDEHGDGKIAKAVVPLHQFYERPNCTKNEQLELENKKGKFAGKIYVMISYEKGDHHHQGHKHDHKHHSPKHHKKSPKHHDHHHDHHHDQHHNQGFMPPPFNMNNFTSGWNNNQQFPPNNPNFFPPPNVNMGGFMPQQQGYQGQQQGYQNQQNQPLVVDFIIKVGEAHLTKDLDTFSKMDPYCVLKIGGTKQKTKTIKGGGKNPHFNQTIIFKSIKEGLLNVAIFDHDPTSDDLVGEGTANLGEIVSLKGAVKNQYVDLIRNGKPAGRVLLAINAQPSNPNF